MRTLDKSKPFETIYGDAPYRYRQDGRVFNESGVEIVQDEPKPTKAAGAEESDILEELKGGDGQQTDGNQGGEPAPKAKAKGGKKKGA